MTRSAIGAHSLLQPVHFPQVFQQARCEPLRNCSVSCPVTGYCPNCLHPTFSKALQGKPWTFGQPSEPASLPQAAISSSPQKLQLQSCSENSCPQCSPWYKIRVASGLRTLSGCIQEALRALYWKNSPLRLPPGLSFASCVAGCMHELWYVEDAGEPLRQLWCGRFTGAEGGGGA